MNLKAIAAILMFSVSAPALAIPVANLPKQVEDCNVRANQTDDFRNLISNAVYRPEIDGQADAEKIAIYGPDDRREIDDPQQLVKLSKPEEARFKACYGSVFCPCGGPDGKGGVGSFGTYAKNDVIVTTLHTFKKMGSKEFLSCMNQCEAQNYRGQKLEVEWADFAKYEDIDPWKAKGFGLDKVSIRLKTPIRGCKPFPVAKKGTLSPGDPVIAVTYPQVDMPEDEFDGSKPIVYPGIYSDNSVPEAGAPLGYFELDLMPGGSGGHVLRRSGPKKELEVVAMLTRASTVVGQPFHSRKNKTTAIVLNPALVNTNTPATAAASGDSMLTSGNSN